MVCTCGLPYKYSDVRLLTFDEEQVAFVLAMAELSIGLGLFEPGSGLDFEKLSGFNRAGRRSKIEIFSG